VQGDWSGGEGLELWSATQMLRVYYAWRHIDVSQGAGENSYGVFRGIFYASHEVTGAPQLNMLGVKLFIDGESVPTDTPACWVLHEPWNVAGYVGSSSVTRGWGWATYFTKEIKGQSEGALFGAFATLDDAFGKLTAFWEIFEFIADCFVAAADHFWDICIGVGAVIGGAVATFCFYQPWGIGVMTWGAATLIATGVEIAAEMANDWFAGAEDVRSYEQNYDWGAAMDRDYGWAGYDWDYPDYYGFDGWDPGC